MSAYVRTNNNKKRERTGPFNYSVIISHICITMVNANEPKTDDDSNNNNDDD